MIDVSFQNFPLAGWGKRGGITPVLVREADDCLLVASSWTSPRAWGGWLVPWNCMWGWWSWSLDSTTLETAPAQKRASRILEVPRAEMGKQEAMLRLCGVRGSRRTSHRHRQKISRRRWVSSVSVPAFVFPVGCVTSAPYIFPWYWPCERQMPNSDGDARSPRVRHSMGSFSHHAQEFMEWWTSNLLQSLWWGN